MFYKFTGKEVRHVLLTWKKIIFRHSARIYNGDILYSDELDLFYNATPQNVALGNYEIYPNLRHKLFDMRTYYIDNFWS